MKIPEWWPGIWFFVFWVLALWSGHFEGAFFPEHLVNHAWIKGTLSLVFTVGWVCLAVQAKDCYQAKRALERQAEQIKRGWEWFFGEKK